MTCALTIGPHSQRLSEQQMMLCLRILRMESMDACRLAVIEYALAHTGSKSGAAAMLGVARKTVLNHTRDSEP